MKCKYIKYTLRSTKQYIILEERVEIKIYIVSAAKCFRQFKQGIKIALQALPNVKIVPGFYLW